MESFSHLLYIFYFSLLAGLFGKFWNGVHDHPSLLEPPYSPYIKPGTDGPFILVSLLQPLHTIATFLTAQSLVCLAWEILTWIPHEAGWKSTRAWWAVLTLVRAVVITSFATFVACQDQYLPLPLGSCVNEHEWRDPSAVPKGTPTIWDFLPTTTTTSRKSGQTALVMPCAVLNRLCVGELVLM